MITFSHTKKNIKKYFFIYTQNAVGIKYIFSRCLSGVHILQCELCRDDGPQ